MTGADGLDADNMPEYLNEAPVHKICALYAAQVCPFVSSAYARHGDEMRRGQRRGAVLDLLGFRATKDVRVIRSELQNDIRILVFKMGSPVERIRIRDSGQARSAYEAVLADDHPVGVDGETAVLIVGTILLMILLDRMVGLDRILIGETR